MMPQTYPDQLTVLRYPHLILRQVAKPVTAFDGQLAKFCGRMFDCMDGERGIGLAAPQVGASLRIFVTDHGKRQGDGHSDRRIWINPRLENTKGTSIHEEGCLSFPSVYAQVERHDQLDIVYQDVTGIEQRQTLNVSAGQFLGVVVQHELDHLDGKVFVDHLTQAQLSLIRGRLRELEKEFKQATGKSGAVLRR
jgi:peptide deformylase